MVHVSHFFDEREQVSGIPRSHGPEVPQVAEARRNVFGSTADGFVRHVPCMVPVQLAPTLWAPIWPWIAWLRAGTGTKHPHHVHAGSMPSMVKPSSASMRQTMAGWPFREGCSTDRALCILAHLLLALMAALSSASLHIPLYIWHICRIAISPR